MTLEERLKEALRHEEAAIRMYNRFAEGTEDAALSEMFRQFAKNESWHAAAIIEKLQSLEERGRG